MVDIKVLNDSDFSKFIQENKIVVVDFWADWCGPCQMFASIFEDFANNNKDISCVKINIDESPIIAEKYNVLSIPTIIIFKEGKNVHQQAGAVPQSFLQDLINKHK